MSIFHSSSTLTLWKSSDGGKFFEEIVEHCYSFGVQGDFIFASVNFETNKDDSKSEKRVMHVSKDSGKTFHHVRVPEVGGDTFYAVIEMYKGMVFLHVDEIGDTGHGTLYISDADGIMYTKSLANHFYTNTGYTDFIRVVSMKGVYMTQKLEEDSTIKSVITFNRGVTWQPLYIDKKKYCVGKTGECTLHFHNIYSQTKHVVLQPPLSLENAPGIILVHGQAGDALTGTNDVWMSRNGGYNWTQVANGPHHYAIGDNGNLIVLVPRLNTTGHCLKYSIDQGRCWRDLEFAVDNDPLTIRGLVTEPHSKERMFSLWGYERDAPFGSKEWIVISINFHEMFSRQCYPSDFEEWYPHTLNGKGGCFLGEKTIYKIPLEEQTCYLGKDYNPIAKVEKCTCTKDDLECDFGYERKPSGTCKRMTGVKLEVCKDGKEEEERYSRGYRRVPGDTCKTTEATSDIITYIDEHKKCKLSKVDIFGIVKDEKKELKEEKEAKEAREKAEQEKNNEIRKAQNINRKKKKSAWAAVIGILVVLVVGVGLVWYGKKYIDRRRLKLQFSLSRLEEVNRADSQEPAYDPRPKGHRPFKDESDVEDDVLLPV